MYLQQSFRHYFRALKECGIWASAFSYLTSWPGFFILIILFRFGVFLLQLSAFLFMQLWLKLTEQKPYKRTRRHMKFKIPILLIYSRFAIGLSIVVLSMMKIDHYKIIAITLFTIGLLTDIFDGIIARRLNISTQKLRRLDSTIDQIFFISFAIATYIECPEFFKSNSARITILFSFEALTYLICFLKFKKEIATHTIGAKFWTLLLFATLVQIIVQLQSGFLFICCFWVGLITRIEIIAIIIALKQWTNDVPSFYHSLKLRKGIEIKRHRLFNGWYELNFTCNN